jgi:hexosaminidase
MTRHCIALLLGLAATSFAQEAESKYNDPAKKLAPIGIKGEIDTATIIPWPMRGEVTKNRITLPPNARIVAATPELQKLTAVLSDQIMKLSGRVMPQATGAPQGGDILVRITPSLAFSDDPYIKLNPKLKGLEHRIVASPKGILVEGVDYKATALATSTLLQTLRGQGANVSLPVMTIEDKPASEFTGVMLDVARQFHPVNVLKDVVDLCYLYKVPYFHIHFTDDQGYRLPSKNFPKVPTEGASYTEEEMRDLVAYADARGVTIVPELEMPGHSGALQNALVEIMGAKDASGTYKALGVLNIANEAAYPVLEKLIEENCDIFKSSPYFHIGADETNFSEFNANAEVQAQLAALVKKGTVKEGQIFSYFLNRMHEVVKKHGKKTIAWEGFGPHLDVNPEIIIMAWHGQSHHPEKLMQKGYPLINVPWTPSIYASVKANYDWNKWSMNLNEQDVSQQFEMTPQIIGGQMVYWEKGPDEALPMLRLKTAARHERLYNPYAQRTYVDFAKRLKHTDAVLERIVHPVEVKIEGLTNTQEQLFFDKPVKVAVTTPVKGGKILYNINEKDLTTQNGKPYNGPIEISAKDGREVYIAGYYGPRVDLRVRVFNEKNEPVGAAKMVELRPEAPRVAYVLKEVPATLKELPADTSKFKVLAQGVLARPESAIKLATDDGPRLLEMKGKMDIRTGGSYNLQIQTINSGFTSNAKVTIGDQTFVPTSKEKMPITLKEGIHDFTIQHLATDGQVGLEITFHDFPQDPEPNKRLFNNEWIHLWLTNLDKGAK